MIDLTTARGRSLVLHGIESRLRRLESDIEDTARPLLRRVSDIHVPEVDNRLLAAIGGGVVAVAAIAFAASFFLRSAPPEKREARRMPPRANTASRPMRPATGVPSNGRASV